MKNIKNGNISARLFAVFMQSLTAICTFAVFFFLWLIFSIPPNDLIPLYPVVIFRALDIALTIIIGIFVFGCLHSLGRLKRIWCIGIGLLFCISTRVFFQRSIWIDIFNSKASGSDSASIINGIVMTSLAYILTVGVYLLLIISVRRAYKVP
jgi:hypothetical protein